LSFVFAYTGGGGGGGGGSGKCRAVSLRHIPAEGRVQSQALKFLADKLTSIEGFL